MPHAFALLGYFYLYKLTDIVISMPTLCR